ncbi:MAG: hypothetical protein KAU21_21650, partial [Gammaproteobacteria bacterium]|nr:hypothetical protein [Gammaproteobacteria bacterium]
NDKPDGYNSYQQSYFFNLFNIFNNSSNLNRVIFITTGSSCSASELVINSLIPNLDIDVIVIGSTTCGKPMGSNTQSHCDKTLSAINFVTRNSADQGDYYDGISASYSCLTTFCDANDDITSPLGDASESSIATALSYIDTGICPDFPKSKLPLRFKSVNRSDNQRDVIMNELF